MLATDISWSRMLQEIARTIPNDTWLTAFQGTSANAGGSTGFVELDADPVDDTDDRGRRVDDDHDHDRRQQR